MPYNSEEWKKEFYQEWSRINGSETIPRFIFPFINDLLSKAYRAGETDMKREVDGAIMHARTFPPLFVTDDNNLEEYQIKAYMQGLKRIEDFLSTTN